MLGLSSGLIKGTSVLRSIVKKGLQAWYKADHTQAPLGEEEIANGRFDEKGPDLIAGEGGLTGAFTGSNFTHHSDGTMTINGDGNRNWAGGNVEGDSVYKVTVDIVSGTSGKFFIGGVSSSLFSGTGINVRYIKTSSSSNLDYVSFNDCDGMVVRSCSVEKMDPNNDWRDFNVNTWQVEDGKLSHTLGNGDSLQCRQNNVIQADKKYQVSYSIVDYTSGSVRVDLGDANRGTVRSAVGNYSEIITNTGTQTFVDIEPVASGSNTFIGAISNISIKEVTNSVKDFSSNTNNGVLYSGKCLHFDDGNNYIDIDYWASKTIDPNTKATFATWVNPDDVSPGHYIFGAWTVVNTALFYLGTKQGKLDLGWGNSGWTSSVTSGTLPTLVNDTWYRVVAVVDGLTCRVYLNGEFVFSKTNTSNFTIHSTGISIGAQGDDVGDHFYGELADFQIYDKAWTVSDVTYDYNNPDKDVFDNSNSNIVTTDCTALYRLNEGAEKRLYNAAPVLGEELVNDGGFATDLSNWGSPSNWVYANGGAKKTAAAGSGEKLEQTISSLVNGNLYSISFDLNIEDTAGETSIGISNTGAFGHVTSSQRFYQTSGTKKIIAKYVSSGYNNTLKFVGAGSSVFTIDNVSVKEISLSESYIQEDWVANRWITAQPYIPQYAMSSFSKKMIFDGSDDYVALSSDTTIAGADPFTISFWYLINSENDTYILGNSSTGNHMIYISASNDPDRFRFKAGGVIKSLDFPVDGDFKLNHTCLTSPGSTGTMKLYHNGVLSSDTEPGLGSDFVINQIGKTNSSEYANGFIDELAIFSKELSEAEVQEIFNAGMALDCRDHSAYLGSEIVDKGDFTGITQAENTTGADWVTQAGWTISGGKASVDSSGSVFLSQASLGITSGKVYAVSFEVSDYTSGSCQLQFGSQIIPSVTSNGVHTKVVTSTVSNQTFYIYAVGASKFSIDNISVKEVQLNGYWRNNGTDTWYDLSPYGNNGTVNGSPTTIQLQEVPYFKKDTFGLPMNKVRERALNLDGDSYIEITDDNSLDFGTGAFSIDGWARFAFENSGSTSGNVIFVSGGNPVGATSGSFAILTNIGNDTRSIRFLVNGEEIDVNITSRVADGDWFHFAATRDTNGNLELYIDSESVGILSATGNSGATVSTTAVRSIGRDSSTSTRNYKNLIDDIRLYNRELLADEVAKNYKAAKSKHKNNIVSNWSDDFSDSFI